MARPKKTDAAATGANETATAGDASPPQNAPLPASITLIAPYAYFDEDNVAHGWAPGDVITDPAEIADLIARGARHK